METENIKNWISNFFTKDNKMTKIIVTHTDTFGGEPNFGWVKRYEFPINSGASQRNIVRRAKSLAGMTGVKADTYDYGDNYTVKPRGYNQVIFVDFE